MTTELTYTVRGADGKEYGPVGLEQLNSWIAEGRLPAGHDVKRSDMGYWAAARNFAELQPAFGAAPPAPAFSAPPTLGNRTAPLQASAAAVGQLKSGASWFYWIAGLSLINSIAAFSGSSWRFIVGLGITQVFDALGDHIGGAGKAVVLLLDVVAAGLFVLFGVFAHKCHGWAFITGMALFALDGLVLLIFQDWLGVGFHAFVLYFLFRGFQVSRQLKGA
jgi:hypothetical protein